MKISLCTITFRHHLASRSRGYRQVGRATASRASESCGARCGMRATSSYQPHRDADWLARLRSNIADGQRLRSTAMAKKTLRKKTVDCAPSRPALAGNRSAPCRQPRQPRPAHADVRRIITAYDCARMSEITWPISLLDLLAKTHPGHACRLRLVDAPAGCRGRPLGIRLEFRPLHVWEGGDDPVAATCAMRRTSPLPPQERALARRPQVFEPANACSCRKPRRQRAPLFDSAGSTISASSASCATTRQSKPRSNGSATIASMSCAATDPGNKAPQKSG